MLKSFCKIMFLFLGSIFLFAQDAYAERIKAKDTKSFVKEDVGVAELVNLFEDGKTERVICGTRDNLCEPGYICLRCTKRRIWKGFGFKTSERVWDEGRCVPRAEYDENDSHKSWPECRTRNENNTALGSGWIIEQGLSAEPEGFINESGLEVIGIEVSRHQVEYRGANDKLYNLAVVDGEKVITYGENNFRGCEVLPVKLYKMQSCFFCPIARVLFKTVNEATKNSFETFASPFMELIVIVFAVWLAIVTLQQVFPFTKKDASDYIELIIKQSFKFLIAYYLLMNSATLFKLFISPVLVSGLKMGEMISGSLKEASKDLGMSEIMVGAGYYNIEYEKGKTLYAQIESYLSSIQSQMAYMQAIGTSLFCIGTKVMVINWKDVLEGTFFDSLKAGLRMMMIGGILTVFGFILSIVFAFYFLDSILQLGLLGMMLPLMIAGWPFAITKNFASKGFSYLLNTFFVFFFTGFVITVNTTLIDESLSLSNSLETVDDSNNKEGGMDSIAKAINDQNEAELTRATNIGGRGFLLLAFVAFIGFKFIKEVAPLAGKLASGSGMNMVSKNAAKVGSMAKGAAVKATAPIRKAVGDAYNKKGGVVGMAGGAVAGLANTASDLAGAMGHKKTSAALAKVGSGGKMFQKEMSNQYSGQKK